MLILFTTAAKSLLQTWILWDASVIIHWLLMNKSLVNWLDLLLATIQIREGNRIR